MQLKFYSLKKLKKEIKDIVGKYLDLKTYQIFFFGSRVLGLSGERADIDLGIAGKEKIPPKIKLDIEEELNALPLLYKFDLVDFQNVSSRFKKEALKNAEYI